MRQERHHSSLFQTRNAIESGFYFLTVYLVKSRPLSIVQYAQYFKVRISSLINETKSSKIVFKKCFIYLGVRLPFTPAKVSFDFPKLLSEILAIFCCAICTNFLSINLFKFSIRGGLKFPRISRHKEGRVN